MIKRKMLDGGNRMIKDKNKTHGNTNLIIFLAEKIILVFLIIVES